MGCPPHVGRIVGAVVSPERHRGGVCLACHHKGNKPGPTCSHRILTSPECPAGVWVRLLPHIAVATTARYGTVLFGRWRCCIVRTFVFVEYASGVVHMPAHAKTGDPSSEHPTTTRHGRMLWGERPVVGHDHVCSRSTTQHGLQGIYVLMDAVSPVSGCERATAPVLSPTWPGCARRSWCGPPSRSCRPGVTALLVWGSLVRGFEPSTPVDRGIPGTPA